MVVEQIQEALTVHQEVLRVAIRPQETQAGFLGLEDFPGQNLSQSQIATLQAAGGNNPNREGRVLPHL